MSLRTRSFLVLVIGTVLGLSLSLGGGVLADRGRGDNGELPWEQARLLAEVMARVKQDYVEPIDDNELLESAIRGMVADLDPHSQFLDREEYEDIRISTTGNYSGVGLEVSMDNDEVVVVAPIDNTPAQRAGILPGDTIITIDDTPVGTKNLSDTVTRMRGKAGSMVDISIIRESYDEPLNFQLVRAKVEVATVRSQLIEPGYGYVRVSQFNDKTAQELTNAIEAMRIENGAALQGVVMDLRNNPGGVLDAAIDVSDLFLEDGLIVTASGRTAESRFSRSARRGDILDGAEMVVLVNGGSASASEIVAGALQDHQRARIVGTETFGKGLVQTVMPLSNGRAIKLTTSRYYTPSGDSIHETGIAPDQLIEAESDLPIGGSAWLADPSIDTQLQAAMDQFQRPRILHSKAE